MELPIKVGDIVTLDRAVEDLYRRGLSEDYQPDYSIRYVVMDTDGDRAFVWPESGQRKGWIVKYEALRFTGNSYER